MNESTTGRPHTPAPWVVLPDDTLKIRGRYQVRGPDEAGPTAAFIASDVRFANARLICAAPDLLNALLEEHGENGNRFGDHVRADCKTCALLERAGAPPCFAGQEEPDPY